jgi:hypothetical protein
MGQLQAGWVHVVRQLTQHDLCMFMTHKVNAVNMPAVFGQVRQQPFNTLLLPEWAHCYSVQRCNGCLVQPAVGPCSTEQADKV